MFTIGPLDDGREGKGEKTEWNWGERKGGKENGGKGKEERKGYRKGGRQGRDWKWKMEEDCPPSLSEILNTQLNTSVHYYTCGWR